MFWYAKSTNTNPLMLASRTDANPTNANPLMRIHSKRCTPGNGLTLGVELSMVQVGTGEVRSWW